MYAKLCNIEILSSYIKELSIGDILTIQALVTNPLDWQHFYDKICTVRPGDRTDFTVVTREGDRLVGSGDVVELDKWSNSGQYGFKVKVNVTKQKSLTDRRIKGSGKVRMPAKKAEGKEKELVPKKVPAPATAIVIPTASTGAGTDDANTTTSATTMTVVTPQDMSNFKEMLKHSLAMDISQ